MTINCSQLKDVIIEPCLNAIGLNSDSAVNLLLGTAAQETHLGTFIVQTNMSNFKGGIGIYQMQQHTFSYIWNRHIDNSIPMKAKIRLYLGYEGIPPASRMASDLFLSTIMARLFYANILEKLPDAKDIKALARYWKVYWNTMQGKGTEEQFTNNYNEYVSCVNS